MLRKIKEKIMGKRSERKVDKLTTEIVDKIAELLYITGGKGLEITVEGEFPKEGKVLKGTLKIKADVEVEENENRNKV